MYFSFLTPHKQRPYLPFIHNTQHSFSNPLIFHPLPLSPLDSYPPLPLSLPSLQSPPLLSPLPPLFSSLSPLLPSLSLLLFPPSPTLLSTLSALPPLSPPFLSLSSQASLQCLSSRILMRVKGGKRKH